MHMDLHSKRRYDVVWRRYWPQDQRNACEDTSAWGQRRRTMRDTSGLSQRVLPYGISRSVPIVNEDTLQAQQTI